MQFRVQFKDVDLSQRIHYTALFRYFEACDHEFFRSIELPYKKLFKEDFSFPRVHVSCEYTGVIEYDDLLTIKTGIKKVGNSSFTYQFDVDNNGSPVAKGSMTIVCMDTASGKPMPLPDYIRHKLEENMI
ncbi:acyl-CoA thioesterase [Bacillus sp. M6-12]|uniref:acyl-CoA thioesterase n=1 Tax=Bacillus sp. M6-12 TaxID=2054166 RepID=UPI0015E1500A|nr:thioesterase family protein [Bacillus sp. M6-12]